MIPEHHFISLLLQTRDGNDLSSAAAKGVNEACFFWAEDRKAFDLITAQFERDGSIMSREMLELDVPEFKFVEPSAPLSHEEVERYARHVLIPDVASSVA